MRIKELLENNPVIAAVKDEETLNDALSSNAEIICVLFGNLITIRDISQKISENNKIGIIHIDLVEGVSNREIVLKYLKEETYFKGIISTKPQMVKAARKYELYAIQRVFVYDGISLNNVKKHLACDCDALEILPGIMPKVIEDLSSYFEQPIVAGGLIETKEEVIQALNCGATSISTSKKEIWSM